MASVNKWQPKRFVRFIESFPSSSLPVHVLTDQGEALLKTLNDRVSPHVLVREWVCTSLADWFGLQTFDFSIMKLGPEDHLPLAQNARAIPGPAFATRWDAGGQVWSGDQKDLKLVENIEALSRLVVFDTWIRNVDRYSEKEGRIRCHWDNVFLSTFDASPARFRVISMDHTECLNSTGHDLGKSLTTIDSVRDDRLFGLFPQFRTFIRPAEVQSATERLASFDRAFLDEAMEAVPVEWQLSRDSRDHVSRFVIQRAAYVADTIEARIRAACTGELPFHEPTPPGQQ